MPLLPQVVAVLQAIGPIAPGKLIALMGKEAAIGILLGLAFGVPFWAAESAGNAIDLQRGASAAQIVDPSMAYETSVTGTLLAVTPITLFLSSGGLLMVAGAVLRARPIPSSCPHPRYGKNADMPSGLIDH